LVSMNNLAVAYKEAGQLDRALPLLEQALKLRQATLGADHPDTLTSMRNLGLAYQAARRLNQAGPLMEESLKRTRASLALGSHDAKLEQVMRLSEEALELMKATARLGAAGFQAGKPRQDLLPVLEKMLKLTRANMGADHPYTLTALGNLAR